MRAERAAVEARKFTAVVFCSNSNLNLWFSGGPFECPPSKPPQRGGPGSQPLLTFNNSNGVMQGHVNRLHHVQCVFPCSYPLSIAHSLTLPPSLSCSACSHRSLPLLSSAPSLLLSTARWQALLPLTSLFAQLRSAKKQRCCSPPHLLSSLSFICLFLVPFFM